MQIQKNRCSRHAVSFYDWATIKAGRKIFPGHSTHHFTQTMANALLSHWLTLLFLPSQSGQCVAGCVGSAAVAATRGSPWSWGSSSGRSPIDTSRRRWQY